MHAITQAAAGSIAAVLLATLLTCHTDEYAATREAELLENLSQLTKEHRSSNHDTPKAAAREAPEGGASEQNDMASDHPMAQSRQSRQYRQLHTKRDATPKLLRVMTFNVRLDAEERDPDNHFTRRVYRLNSTLMKWEPDLVGLQEPFGPQTHHLLSVFPSNTTYTAIGFPRRGISPDDKLHPRRHDDFVCAILYNRDRLRLEEQDYMWLSETPRVEKSRSWDTFGVRSVNIARFSVLPQYGGDDDVDSRSGHCVNEDDNRDCRELHQVLHFNTHLDVRSEKARRNQSALLRKIIADWQQRYPRATVFVTGDFNSAPGQSSHRTLLGKSSLTRSSTRVSSPHGNDNPSYPLLKDAWELCSTTNECSVNMNHVTSTFHGWLGLWTDILPLRPLVYTIFTLHAMQFHLPIAIPPLNSPSVIWKAIKDVFSVSPQYGVWESMPSFVWQSGFSQRHHVDWILHTQGENGDVVGARPLLVAVGDLRTSNFSSDHFPVFALFELR